MPLPAPPLAQDCVFLSSARVSGPHILLFPLAESPYSNLYFFYMLVGTLRVLLYDSAQYGIQGCKRCLY